MIPLIHRPMKRNAFLLLFPIMLGLLSCEQKETERFAVDEDVQTVRFVLTAYTGDTVETKTTYDAGLSQFLWAEGDMVGIISSEGNQLKFPIKPEFYGQSYADFDGRGFALISGNSYSSYYPFVPDYDLNPEALPISYTGQAQAGNNSMAGLGAFAFSAAMGTSPAQGALDFTFRNIGSPHRYGMPVPEGTYTSFMLSIPDEEYISSGTINLLASSETDLISITPVTMSDHLDLALSDFSMSAGGQLRCWMMVPPVDLTGDAIKLILTKDDGTQVVASVAGRDCPANSRRVMSAQTSVWPAQNELSSQGGEVSVCLIRTAAETAVTINCSEDWISIGSPVTNGLVTTYPLSVQENTGAAREGTVSFTETSTGLTNTITVNQQKAGTVIGIGGWETDNHSGNAN